VTTGQRAEGGRGAGSPRAGAAAADGSRYSQAVAPWLEPGERLNAAAAADLSGLIRRRLPRRLRRQEPKEEWRGGPVWRVVGGALLAVFQVLNAFQYVGEGLAAGLLAVVRLIVRPVRGRPFTGGWSSQAGQFVIAVRTGPSSDRNSANNERALVVLTDRRVLLCHDGARKSEKLGDLPRSALTEAVDRGTWFSDRVDLRFSDGSLVALQVRASDSAGFLSAANQRQ
jgi:hypothetical protein